MGFTAVAIVAGLVLGLLTRGRLANIADRRLRWPVALFAGVALQWAPEMADMAESSAFPLVLASYVLLATFAVANLRLVGMGVVTVGLAMNAAVIVVNGGMPVRAEAIVAAGLAEWDEVDDLDYGAKRHLETEDDRLTVLADIIPVRVLREVLSFGDLVLAVGMADVVFRLLRPPRSAGRAKRPDAAPPPPTVAPLPLAAP